MAIYFSNSNMNNNIKEVNKLSNKIAVIKLNKETVSWYDPINGIYLSEFKDKKADIYDDMDFEPIRNGIKYNYIKVTEGEIPDEECNIEHDLTSFYNKKEIDEKVNNFNEQFNTKANINQNYYYVGSTQKYKTISDAFLQWKKDGRPDAVISIAKGVYKEHISLGYDITSNVNLSIIGENKRDVIWKDCTGLYENAPLNIQGNDLLIQGITFIADHSENPTFDGTQNPAYALHIDQPIEGITRIIDCDCISYQNAAIGCGTSPNQHIYLENVNCYNYAPSSFATSRKFGFLYHTYAGSTTSNESALEKLTFKNVSIFSENGIPLTLIGYGTGNKPSNINIVGLNLQTNVSGGSLYLQQSQSYRLNITSNSYGNNYQPFNILPTTTPKISWVNDNGTCIIATDCNNVNSGLFTGDANGDILNKPTGEGYIIGMAINMDTSNNFVLQYCWGVLNGFKKYKRTKFNGTWGSWVAITEP